MENNLLFLLSMISFLINEIRNDCQKDIPILFDGKCQDRYCSKEEFENGICSINNTISKIQWLNKINNFMKNNTNGFSFLKMTNNDIFFISTFFGDEENLYIYGLKSNGEKYFNNENGEDYIKINSNYLETLNSVNIKIDGKEYPLICSNSECVLIDLENKISYNQEMISFFNNTNIKSSFPYTLYFPIINLNQENQYLFLTLYYKDNYIYFNFFVTKILKKDFSSIENLVNDSDFKIHKRALIKKLSCFITEKKMIECFYYESNYYIVSIFSENLHFIENIILDDKKIDEKETFKESTNCIHLKKEIGIFIYYIDMNYSIFPALILQINELEYNGMNYIFKKFNTQGKIILSLDNNTFFDQNDISEDTIETRYLLKINDNKFAYIYDYYEENNCFIVLIVFDLYGINNENLIAKYYKFNHNLIFGYNPDYLLQINIITFNNFIGIAFISFLSFPDDFKIIPYYIIFGDPEQTINEITLNISQNFVWRIKDDLGIQVNNNLFGYELYYKIISVDDSLKNLTFYSINHNKELKINETVYETIYYNASLSFDFTNVSVKIEEHPSFQIMAIIIEPDYEKTISLCDKYDIYDENQSSYYERKIIDEKIIKVKLNFECYITCESCDYVGFNIINQKCSSCKNNQIFCLMEKEGNCYDTLELIYLYYLDSEFTNKLKCIPLDEKCPDEYPLQKVNSKECIKDFNYEDIINKNIIVSNNQELIKRVIDIIYDKIKEGLIDQEINEEITINGNNITIQATTTSNQKYYIDNKIKTNLSIIDLTDCEKNLGIDKPLIILKMDIIKNESFVPQVEYLIINPYSHEIMDLSLCKNSKIDIYVSFDISEENIILYNFANNQGYNILDPLDSFYNDICTPFNSIDNTDVLIIDRKKDYFNDNYTICEEGCEFNNIYINLNKVKCKCKIKKEIKKDTKFSTANFLKNFYKIDSYSNFKIFICYNLVFNIQRLKRNYGNYFLAGIIITFISTTIISMITNTKKVNEILYSIFEQQTKIFEISNIKDNKNIINIKEDEKSSKSKLEILSNIKIKRKRKKKKAKTSKLNNALLEIKINNKFENYENPVIRDSYKIKINDLNSLIPPVPPRKISNNTRQLCDKTKDELKSEQKQGIKVFSKNKNIIKGDEIINTNNELKNRHYIEIIINNIEKEKRRYYFNDEELNSLEYKYAIEIDNRTYIQYYLSLLKKKHLIIFTFISNNDYNIFLLKLDFFLISLSLYLTLNAMFFSDDSIHKQYETKGKYNFIYQLPKILYSTIMSAITNMLLKKLSLSQNDIIKLKHNIDIKKKEENTKKIKRSLTIKFILFIIIGLILLFFFWYYLSCFCSVFANSQYPLFKDILISFGLSMSYPFAINLLPGIFRIPSLKKNSKKLYIISKILSFI